MSILARMLPVTSPWLNADTATNDFIQQNILTDNGNSILVGGSNVGKSSLLFQAGVCYAVEDFTVLFISPEALTKMPLTVHGLFTPNATVLQSVKFMYYSTVKELIDFCSSVHMKPYYPDIIILDNIEFYLSQLKAEGSDHGMAKICALLTDATLFISKHSESGKCKVLLSSCGTFMSVPLICKQFNFNILSIHEHDPTQGRQYDLKFKTKDNHELISSYTIHDTEIRLNRVALCYPT